MRRMDLAVLMAAAWLLGGCATTLRGTTDVLVVESDPPGAAVDVSGATGSTPATFKLLRKGNYVVTISKDGYEPVTVNVTHKIVAAGSAGMAGNILLGGLIGAAVDAGSGAMFDLVPNPIKVKLIARAAPAVASGTSWSAPPVVPRREFTPEDRRAASATIDEMSRLAQALIRCRRTRRSAGGENDHGDLPGRCARRSDSNR